MKEPSFKVVWRDLRSDSGLFSTCWQMTGIYMPGFIWHGWNRLTHPISTKGLHKHNRWIKKLKVGDLVCCCDGNHHVIADFGDMRAFVVTESGNVFDLWGCACAVAEDGSCHEEVTDYEDLYVEDEFNTDIEIHPPLTIALEDNNKERE